VDILRKDEMYRVVITSLAVVSPVENSKHIFWQNFFMGYQGQLTSIISHTAISLKNHELGAHIVCAVSSLFIGNPAGLLEVPIMAFRENALPPSTGCMGGVDALSYAYESMTYGDHDVPLTGTNEALIRPITIAAFNIINCRHIIPTLQ
jgi:3-oxoacyl-(acyl-carrier-protein) synthase